MRSIFAGATCARAGLRESSLHLIESLNSIEVKVNVICMRSDERRATSMAKQDQRPRIDRDQCPSDSGVVRRSTSFGGAPVAVPASRMKLLLQSDCGFGAFRRLGSATIVLLAVPVRRNGGRVTDHNLSPFNIIRSGCPSFQNSRSESARFRCRPPHCSSPRHCWRSRHLEHLRRLQ